MSDLKDNKHIPEELPLDSLIAINLEKIITTAQNELNNEKYEFSLHILLQAKDVVEKDLQTLDSNLLIEKREKILSLISTVYLKMGKYDDCFQNDKEVIFNN